jgi:hypothetical protein
MFTGFTSRFLFTSLIISFILHNLEEAIYICSYPVQSPVSFITPASCKQFLWAVSIITLIVVSFFIVAISTKKQSVYLIISTAIASGLVLNVLIPHIIIAVYSLNYTPGLVTALSLNLPIGLLTLVRNKPNCTDRKQFYRFMGIGLLVGYLIFAIVMGLVQQFIH